MGHCKRYLWLEKSTEGINKDKNSTCPEVHKSFSQSPSEFILIGKIFVLNITDTRENNTCGFNGFCLNIFVVLASLGL